MDVVITFPWNVFVTWHRIRNGCSHRFRSFFLLSFIRTDLFLYSPRFFCFVRIDFGLVLSLSFAFFIHKYCSAEVQILIFFSYEQQISWEFWSLHLMFECRYFHFWPTITHKNNAQKTITTSNGIVMQSINHWMFIKKRKYDANEKNYNQWKTTKIPMLLHTHFYIIRCVHKVIQFQDSEACNLLRLNCVKLGSDWMTQNEKQKKKKKQH